MENSGRNNANGNHKVGNVNVQIGDKEGIYAGSATNMARLFIPTSSRCIKTMFQNMLNMLICF